MTLFVGQSEYSPLSFSDDFIYDFSYKEIVICHCPSNILLFMYIVSFCYIKLLIYLINKNFLNYERYYELLGLF